MRTLDFLKWFCELDDITAVDANSPDNCLLLEHAAHAAFGRFLWALKPTEVCHGVATYWEPPHTAVASRRIGSKQIQSPRIRYAL